MSTTTTTTTTTTTREREDRNGPIEWAQSQRCRACRRGCNEETAGVELTLRAAGARPRGRRNRAGCSYTRSELCRRQTKTPDCITERSDDACTTLIAESALEQCRRRRTGADGANYCTPSSRPQVVSRIYTAPARVITSKTSTNQNGHNQKGHTMWSLDQ